MTGFDLELANELLIKTFKIFVGKDSEMKSFENRQL